MKMSINTTSAMKLNRAMAGIWGVGALFLTEKFMGLYGLSMAGDQRTGMKMIMQGWGANHILGYMYSQVLLRTGHNASMGRACFVIGLVNLFHVADFIYRGRDIALANGIDESKMMPTMVLWGVAAFVNLYAWKNSGAARPALHKPPPLSGGDASHRAMRFFYLIGMFYSVAMIFFTKQLMSQYQMSGTFSGAAADMAENMMHNWGLCILANTWILGQMMTVAHGATISGFVRSAWLYYTLTMGLMCGHMILDEHMGNDSMPHIVTNLVWAIGFHLCMKAQTHGSSSKRAASPKKSRSKSPKRASPKKKRKSRSKSPAPKRRSSRKK
jgi:hypothetical protein